MAKYYLIELDIKDGKYSVSKHPKYSSEEDTKQDLENKNVVYIYRGSKSKKVYIGQTQHFRTRHNAHYSGKEEKFNTADFDQAIVIVSQYFDVSAILDVEAKLITFFSSEYDMKGMVSFDEEVLNRVGGHSVNPYPERKNVDSEVILPLWKELYSKGWVFTKTLEELRKNVLVKYSPFLEPTEQQLSIIEDIMESRDSSFVINGDAGTGKTVMLTHLTARFLNERSTDRIAVVVRSNWVKNAEHIFEVYGMRNLSNLTVTTPYKLVASDEKYDVIIVDEAHQLPRSYGKAGGEINKFFKHNSGYETYLERIQELGHQVVLMYDVLQYTRPLCMTREMFMELTKDYTKPEPLRTQFRIKAEGRSYSSEDYINGIKFLLFKDTGLLETGYTNFDPNFNRDVFRDPDVNAYFGYFEDQPLHQMLEWLDHDRNHNSEHSNRVLSGYVEEWPAKTRKDPSVKHFHEGDIHMRWNSTHVDWLNVKDEDANEQVGSYFAVQGLDLNCVGVLIGGDIRVNEKGKLEANPEMIKDDKGVFKKADMELPESNEELTLLILNIYYILLTRGIDGIRVGTWHNPEFLDYMKKTLEIM